jgi:DNA polymerase-3 subunit gamma/tau
MRKWEEEQAGAQEEQTVQTVIRSTPFTEEELQKCWLAYTGETDDVKVLLKDALKAGAPVLKENHCFEIKVYNPGQKEELESNAGHILAYLHEHLKNTAIRMHIRIADAGDRKTAVTASEKYEHLMSINPLLGELREVFNLSVD